MSIKHLTDGAVSSFVPSVGFSGVLVEGSVLKRGAEMGFSLLGPCVNMVSGAKEPVGSFPKKQLRQRKGIDQG